MAETIQSMRAAGAMLDGVILQARRLAASYSERSGRTLPAFPKVLVVDDTAETREAYGVALRHDGFQVLEAADGHEGLRAALASAPDVIVLDFSMPGMDGAELLRLLRADPRTGAIPVLMVSAYAGEVTEDVRAMCDAVIAKPCGPDVLVLLLRAIAGRRGQGQQP